MVEGLVWSVHFQVSVSQVSGGGSGLVSQVSQFSQVSGGGSGLVSQFSQVSPFGSGQSVFKFEPVMSVSVDDHPT